MKAFLLKVDSEQYIRWSEAAKVCELSVSEWIRKQCNRSFRVPVKDESELRAEDRPTKDVPRAGNVSAPERRVAVSQRGRGTSKRATKKDSPTDIALCRHNLPPGG